MRVNYDFEEVVLSNVQNCIGQDFQLKELFENDKPYLISFLRHFGCIACSEHITEIIAIKSQFREIGVHLVFVGNGKFKELDSFIERMQLIDDNITIVTDSSLEIFEKFGLEYSILSLINVGTLTSAMRAFKKGHRNKGTKGGEAGSHLQQGGIALLDSFHDLQYYFRSEYLGDKPNAQKLLKIAKEFTNNN
jgi:hypothetical protein